jgi:O-antigen ligase
MPLKQASLSTGHRVREAVFAGAVGLWLGLALLKFGNPVIFDDLISPPRDLLELRVQSWPVVWGYWLLLPIVLLGLTVARWRVQRPLWIVLLPAIWLIWQFVAGTQTIDPRLTRLSVTHFCSCVICFYLGHFALSRVQNLAPLWLSLAAAFGLVMAIGFQQHFGGLEETRRFFYSYALPKMAEKPPPEFFQKMASNRIYGTLFYPNTLAGVILLLLPSLTGSLWRSTHLSRPVKAILVGVVAVLGLACLFWSGSKAGWLIMLVLGAVGLLHSSLPKQVKLWIVGALLVAGLGAFALKFQDYFKRGATSVSARLEYWRAAWDVMGKKPILGSGPGTFGMAYRQIKPPSTEMARLAHNDYLQQGSDAGIPALLLYTGLNVGLLGLLYRRRDHFLRGSEFGLWLGLLGVALQGVLEFGLFIPAVSWPQFLFLGWLSGVVESAPATLGNTFLETNRHQAQPPASLPPTK